ncbi:MAG: hypothetical protein JXQ83_14725 [Candidatus Glassbacteria bacterium]|nr:hypothetical protein [Candidatus Glassbacteria bacterium]
MTGRRYLEIDDQPALAQEMDPGLAAERCPSLRKFEKEAVSMIRGLQLKQE